MTEVELAQQDSIFFEHHILLWKDPAASITVRAMKGIGKRMLAAIQYMSPKRTVRVR
ncbi:MAG: hypothetical protein ACYC7D_09660 [Nitrososphaerales archaeon]